MFNPLNWGFFFFFFLGAFVSIAYYSFIGEASGNREMLKAKRIRLNEYKVTIPIWDYAESQGMFTCMHMNSVVLQSLKGLILSTKEEYEAYARTILPENLFNQTYGEKKNEC